MLFSFNSLFSIIFRLQQNLISAKSLYQNYIYWDFASKLHTFKFKALYLKYLLRNHVNVC